MKPLKIAATALLFCALLTTSSISYDEVDGTGKFYGKDGENYPGGESCTVNIRACPKTAEAIRLMMQAWQQGVGYGATRADGSAIWWQTSDGSWKRSGWSFEGYPGHSPSLGPLLNGGDPPMDMSTLRSASCSEIIGLAMIMAGYDPTCVSPNPERGFGAVQYLGTPGAEITPGSEFISSNGTVESGAFQPGDILTISGGGSTFAHSVMVAGTDANGWPVICESTGADYYNNSSVCVGVDGVCCRPLPAAYAGSIVDRRRVNPDCHGTGGGAGGGGAEQCAESEKVDVAIPSVGCDTKPDCSVVQCRYAPAPPIAGDARMAEAPPFLTLRNLELILDDPDNKGCHMPADPLSNPQYITPELKQSLVGPKPLGAVVRKKTEVIDPYTRFGNNLYYTAKCYKASMVGQLFVTQMNEEIQKHREALNKVRGEILKKSGAERQQELQTRTAALETQLRSTLNGLASQAASFITEHAGITNIGEVCASVNSNLAKPGTPSAGTSEITPECVSAAVDHVCSGLVDYKNDYTEDARRNGCPYSFAVLPGDNKETAKKKLSQCADYYIRTTRMLPATVAWGKRDANLSNENYAKKYCQLMDLHGSIRTTDPTYKLFKMEVKGNKVENPAPTFYETGKDSYAKYQCIASSSEAFRPTNLNGKTIERIFEPEPSAVTRESTYYGTPGPESDPTQPFTNPSPPYPLRNMARMNEYEGSLCKPDALKEAPRSAPVEYEPPQTKYHPYKLNDKRLHLEQWGAGKFATDHSDGFSPRHQEEFRMAPKSTFPRYENYVVPQCYNHTDLKTPVKVMRWKAKEYFESIECVRTCKLRGQRVCYPKPCRVGQTTCGCNPAPAPVTPTENESPSSGGSTGNKGGGATMTEFSSEFEIAQNIDPSNGDIYDDGGNKIGNINDNPPIPGSPTSSTSSTGGGGTTPPAPVANPVTPIGTQPQGAAGAGAISLPCSEDACQVCYWTCDPTPAPPDPSVSGIGDCPNGPRSGPNCAEHHIGFPTRPERCEMSNECNGNAAKYANNPWCDDCLCKTAAECCRSHVDHPIVMDNVLKLRAKRYSWGYVSYNRTRIPASGGTREPMGGSFNHTGAKTGLVENAPSVTTIGHRTTPVPEGFYFEEEFGYWQNSGHPAWVENDHRFRPYAIWWDKNQPSCKGWNDAIVGIGDENRNCAYGGWEELKLYQQRCFRKVGVNCLCNYERFFRYGSSESFVHYMAGSSISPLFVTEAPLGSDMVKMSTGPNVNWPLGWRGYVSEPDPLERFPMQGVMEAYGPGNIVPTIPDPKVGQFVSKSMNENLVGRITSKNDGLKKFVQFKVLQQGLKNATPGDILVFDRDVLWGKSGFDPLTLTYSQFEIPDLSKGTGDRSKARLPHVAYVIDAHTPATAKARCVAGAAAIDFTDKGLGVRPTIDYTPCNTVYTNVMAQPETWWVQVSEMNNGKYPDICGNTDKWGTETTRTLYPEQYPVTAKTHFSSLLILEKQDARLALADRSCADPQLSHCVEKLWDRVKIYNPRKDLRIPSKNATCMAAVKLPISDRTSEEVLLRSAPIVHNAINEGCDPPPQVKLSSTISAGLGSRKRVSINAMSGSDPEFNTVEECKTGTSAECYPTKQDLEANKKMLESPTPPSAGKPRTPDKAGITEITEANIKPFMRKRNYDKGQGDIDWTPGEDGTSSGSSSGGGGKPGSGQPGSGGWPGQLEKRDRCGAGECASCSLSSVPDVKVPCNVMCQYRDQTASSNLMGKGTACATVNGTERCISGQCLLRLNQTSGAASGNQIEICNPDGECIRSPECGVMKFTPMGEGPGSGLLCDMRIIAQEMTQCTFVDAIPQPTPINNWTDLNPMLSYSEPKLPNFPSELTSPPQNFEDKNPISLAEKAKCANPANQCIDPPMCFDTVVDAQQQCKYEGGGRQLPTTPKHPLHVADAAKARDSGYDRDYVLDFLYYYSHFFNTGKGGQNAQVMKEMSKMPALQWIYAPMTNFIQDADMKQAPGAPSMNFFKWPKAGYEPLEKDWQVRNNAEPIITFKAIAEKQTLPCLLKETDAKAATVALIVTEGYYRGHVGIVYDYHPDRHCVDIVSANWLRNTACQTGGQYPLQFDKHNCYQVNNSFAKPCMALCVPLDKVSFMWNPRHPFP